MFATSVITAVSVSNEEDLQYCFIAGIKTASPREDKKESTNEGLYNKNGLIASITAQHGISR